jgi:hypothetical protein
MNNMRFPEQPTPPRVAMLLAGSKAAARKQRKYI